MFLFILPGVAAVLYGAGSLALKRSMEGGTSPRRVMLVSNLVMALWSLPLLLFFPGSWNWTAAGASVAAGVALFLGRVLAILALEVGDLSLVAPLLGMKTILVAILSMVFFPFDLTLPILGAAAMATLGVVLLSRSPPSRRAGTRRAAWLALGAGLLFAATDILVQGSAQVLGLGYFTPLLFATMALCSPLLGRTPASPEGARPPLLAGAAIMGLQTPLVVLVIGLTGEAVVVNVVYSTRALWSVLFDRAWGAAHVRDYFAARLLGALLITAAVSVAILSRIY